MISLPDKDDLHQEAAIAAWLAESSHRGQCPLSAWKAIKARYAMTDYARMWLHSRSAARCVEFPANIATPEQSYEPRLMWAIAALPRQYQLLIYLRYWEGRKYGEISQVTGIRETVVSHLLHVITKKLRKLICVTPDYSSCSAYWHPSA